MRAVETVNCDILIVGGGIAGLWALATLRAQGFNALLATDALGKGQTIASQGIIHGGTKYALTGQVSHAALAIGDMPRLWREALLGKGAVDLTAATVLAEHQLLWTSGGVGSRLTGFFASHAMKSRMDALPKNQYPELFKTAQFKGALYQLDEPVLDISSVLVSLQQHLAPYLVAIDPQQSQLTLENGKYSYLAKLADGRQFIIQAQHIILTAGTGNELLLKYLLPQQPLMQRRPLQMVMARGELPLLYAHALGMSDKPRITITSHCSANKTIWYLGGQPAELGVGKNPAALIQETVAELKSLLPWMDFNKTEWATWKVDRAEMAQAGGARPDKPTLQTFNNVTVAWPTKLAFAPMLAQQLLEQLPPHLRKSAATHLPNFPLPPVAKPVWEQCEFQALP